jgi:hypothetical protein
MQIQKRTMGWIQKPTAYQYSQQLNTKRRAQAQQHLRTQSLLSNAIFSAQDAMSQGMVEIAFKAVIAKVQAAARAKIDGGLAEIGKQKTLLGSSSSSSSSSSGSDVLDKTA